MSNKLPDMHCPLASDAPEGENNFWSDSCKAKQEKGIDLPTCYGGCKANEYKGKVLKEREAAKRANQNVDKSHMSWEEIRWLKECFEAGLETKVIAKLSGRSIQTVRLRKRKWKEGLEDGNLSQSRVEQLYRLIDEGFTQEATADIIKCSRNTVGNYIRKRRENETL